MVTLSDIEERIGKLQAQAEAIRKKQLSAVVATIHSLMKEHGLSVADLNSSDRTSRKMGRGTDDSASVGSPTQQKYRDPKTGATWSGRGRAPAWIANAKNRAKFLVREAAVESRSPEKRIGNYPRGPQPAKYRDPKTGAEWSGRGKAPGWLATAKNKSKFLISAASTEAPRVKKATGVRKVAPAPAAKTRKAANARKTTRT